MMGGQDEQRQTQIPCGEDNQKGVTCRSGNKGLGNVDCVRGRKVWHFGDAGFRGYDLEHVVCV